MHVYWVGLYVPYVYSMYVCSAGSQGMCSLYGVDQVVSKVVVAQVGRSSPCRLILKEGRQTFDAAHQTDD